MLKLLHQIFTSRSRDLFLVRLGVTLLLGRLGITGGLARFLSPFFSGFIGMMIDFGIFKVDLMLDSYREGMKLEEFTKVAGEIYRRAMAKKYSEAEKQKIREEYLEIIRKIGVVGTRPK